MFRQTVEIGDGKINIYFGDRRIEIGENYTLYYLPNSKFCVKDIRLDKK